MKKLHAIQFNKITFGMDIEANTKMYYDFKKSIHPEPCINIFGNIVKNGILVVPFLSLSAIMKEAYWLVSEDKGFDKINIPGLKDNEAHEETYWSRTDGRYRNNDER